MGVYVEDIHNKWMLRALEEADKAEQIGEIPVGAVLVKDNELVATGFNQSIVLNDPSAHAEMMAIRAAGKQLENYRLVGTTLYVTLEPCSMCAGLLVHSRISHVVFGAADYKTGCAGSLMNLLDDERFNHQVNVTSGVMAQECGDKLSNFFRARRAEHKRVKQAKLDLTDPSLSN